MKTRIQAIHVGIISLLLAALSSAASPIEFQRVRSGTFSSFVKNWDQERTPVLCAVIHDRAEWNELFGGAAVMGGPQKFAPEPAEWKDSLFLVVSQVMSAPANGQADACFTVQSVEDDGKGTLTVRYTCTPPPPNDTQVKNTLLLKVPRKAYSRVIFMDGGKTTGELGAGRWVSTAGIVREKGREPGPEK